MAVNLDDIQPNVVTSNLSDKIWLFYGEMGTRKTSVACSFPRHILFAYDIGYKLINGANAIPLQSWSDFKSAVKQLDKTSIKNKYDVVVVDTIGMAYQMCYQYMLTQMGVSEPGEAGAYGMGWKKIRNEFETTIRSIAQKGYGLVMLAHSDEIEKEDKVKKVKTTVVKIDIDKRPDMIIKGLADFVFFLHKEVKDETVDTPTVYAYSQLVDIDTKSRSRYFNPRFEFTYENLQHEMELAIQKQYEVEGLNMPTSFERKNYYEQPVVDFEALLKDTVNMATLLVDKGYTEEVNKLLIDVFKGQKLSELIENEDNINKLQVVNTSLSDLKTKARV